ncbi:hypothetical protein JOB18_050100 [Solea senegalensis]|uniref:Uncharacterized protein n=1 Tax=Solea senegalensis TaxID=28829 RepID=A0AAV6QPN3_SOLSE|nr:hypothetical protein JOB18_050100 [Solea senegalensis]
MQLLPVQFDQVDHATPDSLHVIAVDAYYFPPPQLIVDTSVMTETDTVTLFCYSPPAASECYFYTVNTVKTKTSSCRETLTLTGSELLWMVNQSPPTVVRVKCFYTVKKGDLNFPSEHSDVSSITINARREETTELHTTQTLTTGLTVRPHVSTPATPKGLTVSRPHVSTAVTPTEEAMTRNLVVMISTVSVVTVILFLLLLDCTIKGRSGSINVNKQEPQKEDERDTLCNTCVTFTIIRSLPGDSTNVDQ